MVDIFKALSEVSRLRIITLLIDEELCVCEIEHCLDMTQSNASRHLTILRQCGILDCKKKAQWAYYCINERFKEEQKELWSYLLNKLKELPTYETDFQKLKVCKERSICTSKSNPH